MIKKAIQIGDPKVRKKSKSVKLSDIKSKKIKNLVENLIDTMRNNGLVGMAAPQIGVNLNVFVSEIKTTQIRKNLTSDSTGVFINPKITVLSNSKKAMFEGCGSVDYGNFYGPVKRSLTLKLKFYNEHGELKELNAKGLLAQIIQHEYDHLLGILCIDKFTDTRKIFHKEIKLKK